MNHQTNDRRAAPQYLLAGPIIGMAVTGALLIMEVPPVLGPDGGDPVAAGRLAFGCVVFTVAARIVRRAVID